MKMELPLLGMMVVEVYLEYCLALALHVGQGY